MFSMEFSILLVNQILSMVIMALCGYVLGKTGLVTVEESRVLSCICVYLLPPASMIHSFSSQDRDWNRLGELLLGLVCSLLIHLLFLLGTWLLRRRLTPSEQCCIVYNNAGNLILPIVQNLLGEEYVLYTSPYLLVQNLLVWTHGQKSMGGSSHFTVKKVLLTPAIFGILVGLALFITGLPVPGPVDSALAGFSACLGPLSMLVTGIVMSGLDLGRIFRGRRIYVVSLLRLVVFPLLTLLILVPLGHLLPGESMRGMLTVLMLECAGPTASTITQQAQLYHNPDVGYVSSIATLTTLGCIVSIPLLTALFTALL